MTTPERHPTRMSLFGRALFACVQLAFGNFRVRPKDRGADLIRDVIQFRKLDEKAISAEVFSALREEAFLRASSAHTPLLWKHYLPELYEVAHLAADELQGMKQDDHRISQILASVKNRGQPADIGLTPRAVRDNGRP